MLNINMSVMDLSFGLLVIVIAGIAIMGMRHWK